MIKKNNKINFKKLNNWKTYGLVFLVLFFVLLSILFFSTKKSNKIELDEVIVTQLDPYIEMIDSAPTIGPSDAKVTIIEYSDYFCPTCLPLYEEVLEPIFKKYEGKIRFVSIQVDVLMDLGYSSVHAACCADEQGKYWEMHKKLLERIRPFVNKEKNWELYEGMLEVSKEGTPEYFAEMSKTLKGIDVEQFLECMKLNKYSDKIAKTTRSFQKFGIEGVPVLIINGKYFTDNPTQESLSKIIEAELRY